MEAYLKRVEDLQGVLSICLGRARQAGQPGPTRLVLSTLSPRARARLWGLRNLEFPSSFDWTRRATQPTNDSSQVTAQGAQVRRVNTSKVSLPFVA